MKILVVDDEQLLVKGIKFNLENEGYQVLTAYDGAAAVELARRESLDLIILDLMMDDMDGFQVIHHLRTNGILTPLFVLSGRQAEVDKVLALGIGADDYIAKPFSIREVLARVRSVLRRTAQPAAEEKAVAFEGLRMDLTRKVCTIDGEPLALTKKEFEILALLLSSRGKIFSREEILRQVWSDEVIVLDRTIDVNITRLRRKIGPYGEHIVTRLGYGYGFEE